MTDCAKCGGPASSIYAVTYLKDKGEIVFPMCEVCCTRVAEVIETAIRIHPNAMVDSGEPYVAGMSGKATGRGDAKI